MLRSRIFLCALLACAALSGATLDAASAAASKGQKMFFEAPRELLDPATRASTVAQLKELGVHAIRVELPWSEVAPGAEKATRPTFKASNPESYAWGAYEEVLSEAHRLGWEVLLTVGAPAPRWATSNGQAPYVTEPNDTDFEEFMEAVGKKFRADVTDYAIWNEPNEDGELRPQFNAKGEPEAGRIYRGLFQYGYKGLHEAGLTNPTVLMGETSPGGFTKLSKGVPSYAGVAPLTFLRDALCLSARYKREKGCSLLPASGYSQHPYPLDDEGPFDKPSQPEDVTIGTVGRLVADLNKAAKAGAIRKNLPIYLTEFGVMSKPNKSNLSVSVERQADYDAISERIAWENPRVAAFSQYLLEDDPTSQALVSFQTGLEYASGEKKPSYYGFAVPLTVTTTKGAYKLWGHVRPTKKATTVTVLVKRSAKTGYTVLQKVKTGAAGYWTLKSRVKGVYWKVRWVSPEGHTYAGPQISAFRAP